MTSFEETYCAVRRAIIEREYHHLNPIQREAVLATEGPLLLLAGAGSGKTTVLIHRIANLLKYGRGSDTDEVPSGATEEELAFLQSYLEHPAEEDAPRAQVLCAVDPAVPWSIIAITFTNKAAGELKDRLQNMIGSRAADVWASTFHSACLRILRRHIHCIGFGTDFTIYDTADSRRVIKDLVKEFQYDEKVFQPASVLSMISKAKDAMVLPEQFSKEWVREDDWRMECIARLYREYTRTLRDANALDFDDIILHTVTLLQSNEEIRMEYQKKFRYVLIDEYQDTNQLQYLLATLLTGTRKNICVVGDDDQSIYRFRGANIENILNFEHEYQEARVIRLEQNYRSTQNILDAANAVIRHNEGRKGKTLWTNNGAGDKVVIQISYNEGTEAEYVVSEIMAAYKQGHTWKDHAILYRMNAQSRSLEDSLKRNGVPYRIIGGTRFFDRAEVKDMLAYLCVINNPSDNLRLTRIINTPARGIGAVTLDLLRTIAMQEGIPIFQVLMAADQYPELSRAASKLMDFATMIIEMQGKAEVLALDAFYDEVCIDSGYLPALEAKNDMESRGRAENVKELRSSIAGFMANRPEAADLSSFLDDVALYSDLDNEEDGDDCVVLMTMHSAKGLEFPTVYVVGMEENVFPGSRAVCEPEEMEEERRLCYVAMTRAKEHLIMTGVRQRMIFGRTTVNPHSRFLEEIPQENCIWQHTYQEFAAACPREFLDDFTGSDAPCRTSSSSYDTRGAVRPRTVTDRGSHTPAGDAHTGSSVMLLKEGDMVRHQAFGRGMVISAHPTGNDVLLEIAFDEVGNKRLMLKFASAYLTKE